MSEKIVDSLMLQYYKNIFGYYYHTENNKLLFKQYIPDGWDIVMSIYNKPILIIIENKKNKTQKNNSSSNSNIPSSNTKNVKKTKSTKHVPSTPNDNTNVANPHKKTKKVVERV